MENINKGYFQFSSKSDGLYVTVYPPKAGYKAASIDDAMYYIDKKKIPNCNTVALNEALIKGKTQTITIKISDGEVHQASEFGVYTISPDCMKVVAVFYPPFQGADCLDLEEIKRYVENIGVKTGIDEAAIRKFLEERAYGDEYIIAQGVEPRQGKEGYIEYLFNTDLKPSPKMNDDGTVDFHSLENVNHIKKGDVVAVLHPEDRGEAGKDVLGRAVMPGKVKHVIFRHGKNLAISEDGKNLITQVNGHIMLEEDKVFVSNTLELINVDTSTGNIDYDGDIQIKGNVIAGFSVKASGDISISGIVEGATIIAGGSITFNCGIQGMNKAVISAGGDIVSKFIESASSVTAGGNIETDSILHSKVSAKGSITASGRNGLIVGGEVKSTILVEAKTIGNEMGTQTLVGVGVDPAKKKRIDELKKSLQTTGENKIQLNQILTALRKKQQIEGKLDEAKQELQAKTMRNLIMLDQEISQQKREYEEIREQIGEEKNARIKVSKTAYVGTKLVFGDQYMFIKEKYDYCQFMKDGADIKSAPI